MNVDIQEARRLIMLAIKRNPSGINYPRLDLMFVNGMPEMIFGDTYKLLPLLQQMENEGIIKWDSEHDYTKGSNFPEDF